MKCDDEEWQHCRVEKMGCSGCYYEENSKDKMSEKEVIKQLKKILKIRKKQQEIIEHAGGYCENCNPDIKAIETILDLYNKEKEKNKELEDIKADYIRRMKSSNEVILKQDYIHNDKIRNLSNYLEKEIEHNGTLTKLNSYDLLRAIINKIDELLEEEYNNVK